MSDVEIRHDVLLLFKIGAIVMFVPVVNAVVST